MYKAVTLFLAIVYAAVNLAAHAALPVAAMTMDQPDMSQQIIIGSAMNCETALSEVMTGDCGSGQQSNAGEGSDFCNIMHFTHFSRGITDYLPTCTQMRTAFPEERLTSLDPNLIKKPPRIFS